MQLSGANDYREPGELRAGDAAAQWREQWRMLRLRDRDAYPDTLGPPEVFSDKLPADTDREGCGHPVAGGETGPNSRTVTSRLRMSCTEWRDVPTADDFYRAVHEPQGTNAETAILLVWYHEADMSEQLYAHLEGAYSWRALVTALHRVGLIHGEGARRINRFAIEWEPSGLPTAANPTDGAETQRGQGAEHTNQPDRQSGPRAERSELQ